MKKGLIFGVLSMCAVLASAKTFVDKTNLDQLGFRVLDSGQLAWNEEDGSAVMYMGSPSEVKNIRVTDPTALRGYRYKQITSELTLSASGGFVTITDGFRWTSNSTTDAPNYEYEYVDISKTGHDVTYDAESGTASDNGGSAHWCDGLYIKNTNGTYTATTVADGTIIGGSNSVQNVQYAYRHKYLILTATVISKDSNIEELDFTFSQSQPLGLGDMNPIGTSRKITYDGRTATVTIMVNYVSSNGKFVEVSGFTAKCIGIGDVVRANDLAVNKILIYDKLTDENGRKSGGKRKIKGLIEDEDEEDDPTAGAFDLYNLRSWAKHLYDGNRGVHWANYAATNHVFMKNKCIYWGQNSTYMGNAMMGVSGDSFFFSSDSTQWLTYTPSGTNAVPAEYQGIEIAITAINKDSDLETDPNCWTIDVDLNVPTGKSVPGLDMLQVLYSAGLERPCLWYPIVCEWRTTDNGAGLSYHVVIPEAYGEPETGFWKIKLNTGALAATLKVKARIQAIGDDGRMYNLIWPEGGGAVTATLAD